MRLALSVSPGVPGPTLLSTQLTSDSVLVCLMYRYIIHNAKQYAHSMRSSSVRSPQCEAFESWRIVLSSIELFPTKTE